MKLDYTDRIVETNTSEITYPITFTLLNSGDSRLALVKIIKEVTGMGLKESKDFMDTSAHSPVIFRKNMTLREIDNFKSSLISNTSNAKYILDDQQRIRNKKLIDLGICDKEDLISEIVSSDIQMILSSFDIEKLRVILSNIYSNFDEENLKKLYNNKNK